MKNLPFRLYERGTNVCMQPFSPYRTEKDSKTLLEFLLEIRPDIIKNNNLIPGYRVLIQGVETPLGHANALAQRRLHSS